MLWKIHYADRTLRGRTVKSFQRAPKHGVQVIAVFGEGHNSRCREDGSLVGDRKLYTGEGKYELAGCVKYGSLISDADYWRIWEEACDGEY